MADTSMFGWWDYPNFLGYSITSWLLIFMLLFVVLNFIYTAIAKSCKGKKTGLCSTSTLPMMRLIFLLPCLAIMILLGFTAIYTLTYGFAVGWEFVNVADIVLSIFSIILFFPIWRLSLKKGGGLEPLQIEGL